MQGEVPDEPDRPFVLEFLGPPASGKTTLACAVIAELRRSGISVGSFLSSRPDESPGDGGRHSLVRRIVRPLADLISAAARTPSSREPQDGAALMQDLLPPRNPLWSIRLRHYTKRLRHARYPATPGPDVLVFDQGCAQCLASYCVLSRDLDPRDIGPLLRAIPRADLVVELATPAELLFERLRRRRRQLAMGEGLLELSFCDALAFVPTIAMLRDEMHAAGWSIARIDTGGLAEPAASAARIVADVMTVRGGSDAERLVPARASPTTTERSQARETRQ